jgi:hypothetical protein
MAHDTSFGLVVFLFTGETAKDEDFEAYCAGIDFLKAWHGTWTLAETTAPCAILVVDPGSPSPNAHWRKRIADASKDVKPPAYFALVSTSAIVRGVVTAINWIRPPPYEFNVVTTFAAAVHWMEGKRGVKLPAFRELLQEARERALRGDRSPTRAKGSPKVEA